MLRRVVFLPLKGNFCFPLPRRVKFLLMGSYILQSPLKWLEYAIDKSNIWVNCLFVYFWVRYKSVRLWKWSCVRGPACYKRSVLWPLTQPHTTVKFNPWEKKSALDLRLENFVFLVISRIWNFFLNNCPICSIRWWCQISDMCSKSFGVFLIVEFSPPPIIYMSHD